MKTHFLLFIFILTQFSCNNDDMNVITESDFFGEWVLISTTTNREVDYDFDGDSALGIIEDFECFTIELVLNNDGTFEEVTIDRLVDNGATICQTFAFRGNWRLDRESVKIIFEYTNINDEIINTIENSFIVNKNDLQIQKEFTDNSGNFEALLFFSRLN